MTILDRMNEVYDHVWLSDHVLPTKFLLGLHEFMEFKRAMIARYPYNNYAEVPNEWNNIPVHPMVKPGLTVEVRAIDVSVLLTAQTMKESRK